VINMKLKTFLAIAVITCTITLSGLIATQPAQATKQPWQICGEGEHIGNPHCIPSITDEVTPTEEVVPTVEPTLEVSEEPTASPTAEITQTSSTNGGDNHGDGLSDGLSSCPSCTKAPSIPSAPPKTGRAL
jgi:hypothetical protein